MKKKVIFAKKKGFTLVELLIVLVIVGVLSGLLMVSASGALDKAEATRISSDLKNIRSASFLYFADKSKWPSADITLVNPYLSAKLDASGDYSFVHDGTRIKARYHNADMGTGVMVKLQEMQDNGVSISVDVSARTAELFIRE